MTTEPTDTAGRISRLEWIAFALATLALGGLVIAEPDVLGAPVENSRTLLFTIGGTLLAAVALVVMVKLRIAPLIRVVVLGVPLAARRGGSSRPSSETRW